MPTPPLWSIIVHEPVQKSSEQRTLDAYGLLTRTSERMGLVPAPECHLYATTHGSWYLAARLDDEQRDALTALAAEHHFDVEVLPCKWSQRGHDMNVLVVLLLIASSTAGALALAQGSPGVATLILVAGLVLPFTTALLTLPGFRYNAPVFVPTPAHRPVTGDALAPLANASVKAPELDDRARTCLGRARSHFDALVADLQGEAPSLAHDVAPLETHLDELEAAVLHHLELLRDTERDRETQDWLQQRMAALQAATAGDVFQDEAPMAQDLRADQAIEARLLGFLTQVQHLGDALAQARSGLHTPSNSSNAVVRELKRDMGAHLRARQDLLGQGSDSRDPQHAARRAYPRRQG